MAAGRLLLERPDKLCPAGSCTYLARRVWSGLIRPEALDVDRVGGLTTTTGFGNFSRLYACSASWAGVTTGAAAPGV